MSRRPAFCPAFRLRRAALASWWHVDGERSPDLNEESGPPTYKRYSPDIHVRRAAWAMVGRRLSDGAVVAEPASDQLRWIVSSVLLLVAAGSCPSHDSFTAYLGAMAQHPSDLLGGLSAIVESVHIAVAATSSSWVVLRIGRFRSDPYLGVFGTWFPLPSLDVPWPLRLRPK